MPAPSDIISDVRPTTIVGRGINRVDARPKVTGAAHYAADNYRPKMTHAVGVFSSIAHGSIKGLETAEAENAPGVIAVLHHGNLPKVYRSPNEFESSTRVGEIRPPFEDDKIYYAGQFVALVVAETFEQARYAARRVKVHELAEGRPALTIDEGIERHGEKKKDESPDYERGKAPAAEPLVDETYTLPVEVHNPMELHASMATWEGDALDIYESTQWVVGQRKALARVLGVPDEKITVHSPYIGGGFGGKLFLWPHTVLAAVAARVVHRPVKLVVDRHSQFTTVGHRPLTRQRVRLNAEPDGTLTSLQHESWSQTSLVDEYLEQCGSATPSIYQCPHVRVTHRMVPGNVGTPTSMRAPGAVSGLVATESALDELAVRLKLDPIDLRLKNLPEKDGKSGHPWSSIHFRECIEQAREKFGWARRNPVVGAMRDGDEIVGWGYASATWSAERAKAEAKVELRADGTARVSCATQDIGTGTYTVVAQLASEVLGIPVDQIEVAIGSSSLPEGPISGGSMVTATISPAIVQACEEAKKSLFKAAVKKHGAFAGQPVDSLALRGGEIVSAKIDRRASIADVLGAERLASVEGHGKAAPGEERKKYAFRSFGAHCVEVRWDPGIARLRVSRVVSVMDAGRTINEKTALNQIYGAIVMGIGMGRLEQSIYDHRDGKVVTDNLADYLVPVHADAPEMDVTLLNFPDPHMGGFGARGLGEIGITGIAPAIANAVYHATGKRVRDFPITVEKLLG